MSRNGNAYYYYSDDKVREVQRKLNYMRADAPPKGALTIRKKDEHCASPSSSIHELLLNDEKYSYLKASFKQQFSPSQSSTKHFDFDGKSTHSPARDESNHNRYGSGHYGSGPLNRAQDQGDTRSSNVSSTLQTQLVQNILSTSPTHRPQHDVSDHPLVHELSRRGLTSSCKKRKTQTEVRREVETKLLFS